MPTLFPLAWQGADS